MNLHAQVLTLLVSIFAAAGADPADRRDVASPLSAAESLTHFQLPPGLRIELVAAEPEVVDPVDIRFDEAGRLWVAEMRDYPSGPATGEKSLSRIRWLEDLDRDGRYETAHDFAENLTFVNGLQPWRGGVIATMAGAVAFFPDDDRDGRADRQEIWYRGFAEENSQLRASNPRLGIDGRVYIANGLRGGKVVDVRRPERAPLSISGMDFCFDPLSGDCEAVSGMGQFGMTFDAFGRRFVCTNRNPVMQVMLEDRYLKRNPQLAVPNVTANVAAAEDNSRVFPLSQAWTTSNLHAGQFTAACGVQIFDSDALGDAFRGAAFICEPTGNLLHCERLLSDGAAYRAEPVFAGKEFLATPDSWFRPVNSTIGPDGNLYLADMYRAVIEHPDWMPEELRTRRDLRDGDDRGRIYRIVRPKRSLTVVGRLPDTATPAELVEMLDHPVGWWRDTATRLLQLSDHATIGPLLANKASKLLTPAGRVRALWLLAMRKEPSAELLAGSLADSEPDVREAAVQLAESLLSTSAGLHQRVLGLAADPAARVRFQVALSLGGKVPDSADIEALASIGLADGADPWTRRAVASSCGNVVEPLVRALVADARLSGEAFVPARRDLLAEISQLVSHDDATALLTCAADNDNRLDSRYRFAIFQGVAAALRRKGITVATFKADESLRRELDRLAERAAQLALDRSLSEADRFQAIDVLRGAATVAARTALIDIATSDDAQVVRAAAIRALSEQVDRQVAEVLLANLATQTPAIKREVLDLVLGNAGGCKALLDRMAEQKLLATDLDPLSVTRLKQHPAPEIRNRAGELLPGNDSDRLVVIEHYRQALGTTEDSQHGAALFARHCATCHRIGGIGVDVAPDISDSRVKTREQLLTDILDPSRAIDNNYVSYTVATQDGRTLVGVIGNETATSVTLRQPENNTVSLLRSEIAELRSNGVSLMPDGFEKTITPAEMADLVGYVKNWRYLDGSIPLKRADR